MTESQDQQKGESRRDRWVHGGLSAFCFLLLLGAVALVVAPLFMQPGTYGGHDWDQMTAHRYLAVKTIKQFHQFPFWDPYSCGGHTWWGGLESGTNLVSPWLPAYLWLPLPAALRVEIVGAAALGAVGSWALAGRFTRSPGIRLLCAVAFALNSRWAWQISVGHVWHLYYAWTPWALFFFDRAVALRQPASRSPLREVVLLAVTMAMMVYMGGIYPLPQTAIVLGIYAVGCAVASRSWRPLTLLAGAGGLAFAFAAPRLLPILEMLRRFPRLVDSPESMDLAGFLAVFTAKGDEPHAAVGPWGWHEFAIYVGWVPLLAMLAAPLLARRARERSLVAAGVFCLVLAFGRFSPYAPWGLLHDRLPVFASQHVPSRWLYPAVLLLLVAMAAILERWIVRAPRRVWLEVSLVFLGAYFALDIGLEAQRPIVGAFGRPAPSVAESTVGFHQEKTAPAGLSYAGADWTTPSLPAMMANVGVISCGTFPGLHDYYRDRLGRVPGLGAKGTGEAAYAGETHLVGPGSAEIESWTPNVMIVHYSGATPGEVLALNQNWDPGWRADGRATFASSDLVATNVDATSGEITFRYRPPWFVLGCVLMFGAIFGLIFASRRRARAAPDVSA